MLSSHTELRYQYRLYGEIYQQYRVLKRDQLDTDVQYVTQLEGQSDRIHVNVTNVVNGLSNKHVAYCLYNAMLKNVKIAHMMDDSAVSSVQREAT